MLSRHNGLRYYSQCFQSFTLNRRELAESKLRGVFLIKTSLWTVFDILRGNRGCVALNNKIIEKI